MLWKHVHLQMLPEMTNIFGFFKVVWSLWWYFKGNGQLQQHISSDFLGIKSYF